MKILAPELKSGVTQLWDIYKNDVHTVNSQDLFYCDLDNKAFNQVYKRMEINEERLIQMGFIEQDLHYFKMIGDYIITVHFFDAWQIAVTYKDIVELCTGLYEVHHLQDIFYTLTNIHLKIPEKKK